MPTDKRQRQKRAHRARAQQVARLKRKQRRSRVVTVLAVLGAMGFILALAINYSAGDKPKGVAAKGTTSTSSDLGLDAPCPRADGRSVRETKFRRAPPLCIDRAKSYIAKVETDLGSFDISLDQSRAPDTVNNFVFLARYHFYDGFQWNKIIPGSYIQGGNPPGDPTDAGYLFADELPPPGLYKIGSVIMANNGPNTNGSQFIVLTGPDIISKLNPPKFTLFGEVSAGMDVVQQLGANANATHVIKQITISES
ncbi:MAG TPA: peptidylprolyl isomerase [Acidimicrobiales bacterium]|nr:peptidylprolyl isomerase [Acidimicrobiales bacterium]